MKNNYYSELTGICKRALRNNICLGCQKLENKDFKGQDSCSLVENPIRKINKILGIQEKIQM